MRSSALQVETTTIQSLGELLDRTTPREPDAASGRLRANSVFRGVAGRGGSLLTGLDRLGGTHPPHTKKHLEEHLLRNFIRYGHQFLPEAREALWPVMVAAEHHGLPTRLLDWSHSPLIAAHFATLGAQASGDRVIWKLNWRRLHRGFGLREVTFLIQDLEPMLTERGFSSSWEFLNEPPGKGREFVCLLEPPAFIPRLEVQSGAFTLASSKEKALETILADAGLGDALEQFIIPARRVDFIRDQLDICAVDESHLFPGLDGIAAALRRYYSSSR